MRDIITIKEFCEYYRISRAKLHLAWKDGGGPRRIKVGRTVRLRRTDCDEWFNGGQGHGYNG